MSGNAMKVWTPKESLEESLDTHRLKQGLNVWKCQGLELRDLEQGFGHHDKVVSLHLPEYGPQFRA